MEKNKSIAGFSHKQIIYFYIAAVVLVIAVIGLALLLKHSNRLASNASLAANVVPPPGSDDFSLTCPGPQTIAANQGGAAITATFPALLTPGRGYGGTLEVFISAVSTLNGEYDSQQVSLIQTPQTVNLTVSPTPPTAYGSYAMRITARELTPAAKIYGKIKNCDTQLIISATGSTSPTLSIIGAPTQPLAMGALWQFPQPQYDSDGSGPVSASAVQPFWSVVPTPTPALVSIDQNGLLHVLTAVSVPASQTIKATYQGIEATVPVTIAPVSGGATSGACGTGYQTITNGPLQICGPVKADAQGNYTVIGKMTDDQPATRLVVYKNGEHVPRCNAVKTCSYSGTLVAGHADTIRMLARRNGVPVADASIVIPAAQ